MFKGDLAQPETIKRRPYHREYYQQRKTASHCPDCGHFKSPSALRCVPCGNARRKPSRTPCPRCDQPKSNGAKLCAECRGKCEICSRPISRWSSGGRCKSCAAKGRDRETYRRAYDGKHKKPTSCPYCLTALREVAWHGSVIFRCPDCGLELKEAPPYFEEVAA